MQRRERVRNGYGITTSALSITHVGLIDGRAQEAQAKELQQQAACVRAAHNATERGKQQHNPSRRNLHMQQFYPETKSRLQAGPQLITPRELKDVTFPSSSVQSRRLPTPMAVSNPSWCSTVRDERNINRRHHDHLQVSATSVSMRCIFLCHSHSSVIHIPLSPLIMHVRRARLSLVPQYRNGQSVVSRIVEGQDHTGQPFKPGSDPLFPQKATHTVLLGITGKIPAPNPHRIPDVPPSKPRWLGDRVGWSP